MRIVSGGQAGVDRAALDAALDLGVPCEGWCPAGRAAEDGPLPERYPLRETPSSEPAERTAWNVRDSDATLVLSFGAPRGGTAFALAEATRLSRPVLALRLGAQPDPSRARAWLVRHAVRRLHVAGPRESEEPGVGAAAERFLRALLAGGD